MPQVSVVLPTYNRAGLLREAIASIQAQTFHDWELLVVDDGSTDETGRVIETAMAADARIRCLRGAHHGVSAARNLGVREARSNFVAFLDDDDLWLPHKLEHQITALKAHPEWAFVYTQAELRYGNGMSKVRQPMAATFPMLLEKNTIAVPAVLIRRKIFIEMHGFPEQMDVAEDVDLWLRIASKYPFGVLDSVLTICRQSLERNDERYRRAVENHLVTLEGLLGSLENGNWRRLVRRKIAKEHYKLARLERAAGQYRQAALKFLRSVCADWRVGLSWKKKGSGNSLVFLLKPYVGVAACGIRAVLGGSWGKRALSAGGPNGS
jgi:glycosyltransferase involved in cell wall biosynthesis